MVRTEGEMADSGRGLERADLLGVGQRIDTDPLVRAAAGTQHAVSAPANVRSGSPVAVFHSCSFLSLPTRRWEPFGVRANERMPGTGSKRLSDNV
jgi:hypothetical protein